MFLSAMPFLLSSSIFRLISPLLSSPLSLMSYCHRHVNWLSLRLKCSYANSRGGNLTLVQSIGLSSPLCPLALDIKFQSKQYSSAKLRFDHYLFFWQSEFSALCAMAHYVISIIIKSLTIERWPCGWSAMNIFWLKGRNICQSYFFFPLEDTF